MAAIKAFLANHLWSSVFAVMFLSGGAWWYLAGGNDAEKANFSVVERGTVSQLVSVTGTVRPASEVSLSFEKSGRIEFVYRDVGDRVQIGSALVTLENSELSAQLAQAEAAVRVQEARLQELKKGTRPEDILVSEVDVKNSKDGVINDLKTAYVNSDDAIRNKVDQLFSNPKSANPQFNYAISNFQLETDIESGRSEMESILNSWSVAVADSENIENLYSFILGSKANLRRVQNYLDEVASAVNSLSSNSGISQTTIDTYKAAILAGRSNVTTALESLSASEEKLRTADSKLALKRAGTIQEQIDAKAAEVDSAKANVLALQAQIAKTVIRSPIAGIVIRQDAKKGEIASAGSQIVSIISDAKYEIEANIPEADIAKIKIGNIAEVTLDAYPDVFFKANVTKIDPAETVIEGVATYKTTLQFSGDDTRIRSGMTANTDIAGESRENVLLVPGRAVSQKEGKKFVELLEGETTREVEIETGLRGSSGDIEVISGLKEGDRIRL
ncbi:MAG TPA: efflux RND transporter periplasmic adaptor subunit [Candidatus Paceibacterota bacterium]